MNESNIPTAFDARKLRQLRTWLALSNNDNCVDVLHELWEAADYLPMHHLKELFGDYFLEIEEPYLTKDYSSLVELMISYVQETDEHSEVTLESLLEHNVQIPVMASNGFIYDLNDLLNNKITRDTIEPIVTVVNVLRNKLEKYAYANNLQALSPMPVNANGMPAKKINLDTKFAVEKFLERKKITQQAPER